MNELLFVYGTLKDPEVQQKVIGRVVEGFADVLQGYIKSTIEIEGKTFPIIVSGGKAKIEGIVLKVTEEELVKMDIYETKNYKRTKVVLESGVSAWVYQKP